jgi:hypothetical protein
MSAGALRNCPAPRASSNPVSARGTLAPRADTGRLRGLAEVLSRHGLQASLITRPGCAPGLHVVNPAASVLAEEVYAKPGRDGTTWFWWSWAEPLAAADDLEAAAALIKKVLAARAQTV